MPASTYELAFEYVEFRRGHADVDGSVRELDEIPASLPQEVTEGPAQVVVRDFASGAPSLLGRLAVVHIERWVGEHHVCVSVDQHPLVGARCYRIAAQHAMLAQYPQGSWLADGLFGN